MTPEQEAQFQQMQAELTELRAFVQSLKSSTTIPYDVDGAFRTRLGTDSDIVVSAKDVDSEDQSVNEGGSATYNVLKEPDGFLQVTISGSVYYLPYYG